MLPDLGRADCGVTLLSRWLVGEPGRVGPVAEALVGEWNQLSKRFAPPAFLRLTCFASGADSEVLCCAQWTSDEEHRAFTGRHRSGLIARIDRTMPGITRPGLVRYHHDRRVVIGTEHAGADRVVLVQATATGAAAARAWAVATGERLAADR